MKVKVTVTADDINACAPHRNSTSIDPIARALQRLKPKSRYKVGQMCVYKINRKLKAEIQEYLDDGDLEKNEIQECHYTYNIVAQGKPHSDAVRKFLEDWDDGKTVQPQELTLELPR